MNKKRAASGWKSSDQAKHNKPPEGKSWIWMTREMHESPAWLAMPLAARKIIDRLIVEHLAHAGTENGNLISTYSDFEKFEIRRMSIRPAIIAAEVLGFIDVVKRGGSAYAEMRNPSIYSLAWLYRKDGTPPADRWKTFKTVADARKAVHAALATRGRKSRHPKKQNASSENATSASSENATSRGKSRERKRYQSAQKPGAKSLLHSIFYPYPSACEGQERDTACPPGQSNAPTNSKTDDNADPQQPSCRAAPPGARQGAVAAPSSGGVRPAVAAAQSLSGVAWAT